MKAGEILHAENCIGNENETQLCVKNCDLILAAGSGQTEKVKLFLENGQIDVNHILDSTDHPNNGHTALTLASMNGHDDVVELLLKNEKNRC